jgi:hypothetical protein
MKLKDFINVLNEYNPNLPVCYFDSKTKEYFEIECDMQIGKVWDKSSKKWMLSLNESVESMLYRLGRFDDYEKYP